MILPSLILSLALGSAPPTPSDTWYAEIVPGPGGKYLYVVGKIKCRKGEIPKLIGVLPINTKKDIVIHMDFVSNMLTVIQTGKDVKGVVRIIKVSYPHSNVKIVYPNKVIYKIPIQTKLKGK